MNLVDFGFVGLSASATKNILENRLFRATAQAVAVAGLTHYLSKDWRLAGLPMSIGAASSGWSDFGSGNFLKGASKIFLSSVIVNGNSLAIDNRVPTLEEATIATGAVAVAGLVHAVGSKVVGVVVPYLAKSLWQFCKDRVNGAYDDYRRIRYEQRHGQPAYSGARLF